MCVPLSRAEFSPPYVKSYISPWVMVILAPTGFSAICYVWGSLYVLYFSNSSAMPGPYWPAWLLGNVNITCLSFWCNSPNEVPGKSFPANGNTALMTTLEYLKQSVYWPLPETTTNSFLLTHTKYKSRRELMLYLWRSGPALTDSTQSTGIYVLNTCTSIYFWLLRLASYQPAMFGSAGHLSLA